MIIDIPFIARNPLSKAFIFILRACINNHYDSSLYPSIVNPWPLTSVPHISFSLSPRVPPSPVPQPFQLVTVDIVYGHHMKENPEIRFQKAVAVRINGQTGTGTGGDTKGKG